MMNSYPCRCLWRGFLQITRITPLRLVTLHCEQIIFTEDRTFIFLQPPNRFLDSRETPVSTRCVETDLFRESVSDPSPGKVIGGKLQCHLVSRNYFNIG